MIFIGYHKCLHLMFNITIKSKFPKFPTISCFLAIKQSLADLMIQFAVGRDDLKF